MRDTTTESGRATNSRTSPTRMAGSRSSINSLGLTSSPSRTKRPICASQPSPSAKDRVADRCGRPELASTTAAR
ncbi:Uncharacterised protein [Mycobacteroides abscessus]|nr:Uncharacterised protein [Mycobacteroides abscessus]